MSKHFRFALDLLYLSIFVYILDLPVTAVHYITKTRLFKYIEISRPKTENFQIKNSDIFHISAQNIDCGYSLEPPRPTICIFEQK